LDKLSETNCDKPTQKPFNEAIHLAAGVGILDPSNSKDGQVIAQYLPEAKGMIVVLILQGRWIGD